MSRFKFYPPETQNFVYYKHPVLKEGDPAPLIAVQFMTDEEAEEYGELIKQTFLEHRKVQVDKLKN